MRDVLWGYIKQFHPIMLTTFFPRESRGLIKETTQDKIRWMKKNFGAQKRMRVVKRQDKKKVFKDGRDKRPNVLIDDQR